MRELKPVEKQSLERLAARVAKADQVASDARRAQEALWAKLVNGGASLTDLARKSGVSDTAVRNRILRAKG